MIPTFRRILVRAIPALGLALLVLSLLPAPRASADDLPFKAWGSGRTSGEVVRAFKGSTQVGQYTVNSDGAWEINITAAGTAGVKNGDSIGFTVDGKSAAETVTWTSGQFVPVPGLKLTTSGTATPTPAPTYTLAAGVGFAATPVFDPSGKALAVFKGGTVDDLVGAATSAKATGIWLQDASGSYQLFIIGGPSFIGDAFRAKFTAGFSSATSVLLTK